jgi:HEAT repeat protein
MAEQTPLERFLGTIGTTFRLIRLYPPTHPAVQESLRQLESLLPELAAFGTIEWKVGATGMHWHGQHILARNTQLSEFASLLFTRNVRGIQLNPGVTADHIQALFGVATGSTPPDDASLGRVTLIIGRRTVASARPPTPQLFPTLSDRLAPPPEPPKWQKGRPQEGRRSSTVLRQDALPPDVECRRLLAALATAEGADSLRGAAERLHALIPDLLELRDVALLAEIIAGIDRALPRLEDEQTIEHLGAVGEAIAQPQLIDRLVARLGEPRIQPTERGFLVNAVGALATITVPPVLRTYLSTPAELREPYRAAIRVAADRAMEPLEAALGDADDRIVAAAAHFLGLTGSPEAITLLGGLLKHPSEEVREAALYAMAEIGGKDVARPGVTALRDLSAAVRAAAARVIGVGGDPSATPVLVRRLEHEEDEGVLASILTAVGRLGGGEALGALAKYAEPGSFLKRRTPHLRAAAIEGIGHIHTTEARALLELYSHDKEPAVRRAAEAALQ